MKHAKFFSVLVSLIALLYGAIGFYCLPLASYEGDLTRIGMLPESLFGWTRVQPAIDPAHMRQSSWQEAEVLVVGDSFSEPRVWQSALTSRGLKVRTEHWGRIHSICDDFASWLRAQGFKGKYVVIESIERDVKHRFTNSVRCKKMDVKHKEEADKPQIPPVTTFDHAKKDFSGKASVGIKTRINTLRYEHLSAQPDFRTYTQGSVRVTRVAGGCDLFSHLRCRDALFISLDSDQDLGEEIIDIMDTLNARLDGFIPIWAIVPNKSTAYLYPDKHFWGKLEQRLPGVNLLKTVRKAIENNTVDVYPANNTHFSTTGYLLMGDEIYRNIQRQAISHSRLSIKRLFPVVGATSSI